MTTSETTPDPSADGEPAIPGEDPPVVLSPGDSDAPDAPDTDTIYPDEPGTPGDPDR